MDVKTIAAKYGGLPARVVARAEENWRVTSAKKSARWTHLLVLWPRALEEPVDKKRLAKCAGANSRLVEPTVRKVVDAVGVRTVVKTSPAALCIKSGCEALTEIVHRVLDEYRAYLAKVAAANRRKRSKHPLGPAVATMNGQDPVFAAACLLQLAAGSCVRHVKEFDAIVSSIEAQCQASLSGAIMDRKKRHSLAGERAARKLTEQYRLEQLKEEERAKRQRTSLDGEMASPPKTLAQERVLQRFEHLVEVQQQHEVLGHLGKYAEWRAMALEFMRNKKEKEAARNSDAHVEKPQS
ncbi:hypothetical protein GQ600_18282 [Phytophthora cactorum]|nr:hypothetical protein GQ600_18282 [Phytophthora cactorum]